MTGRAIGIALQSTPTHAPRNVLLTGVPRSGTTLVCHLLNKLPETVALHEPLKPGRFVNRTKAQRIDGIQAFFAGERLRIVGEGKATSRAVDGRVPTNHRAEIGPDGTRAKLITGNEIIVTNVSGPDFALFIKHPILFTALLSEIVGAFECYALVRNPLAVILSWRNSGMGFADGRAPAGARIDAALAMLLGDQSDPLERQLLLLDYCFARYVEFIPDRTIRYEEVIESGGRALAPIEPKAAALDEPLESRNALALATDPEARRIGEALLARNGAWWRFYTRDEVEALLVAAVA